MKRKLVAAVLATTFMLGSASPALGKNSKKKKGCRGLVAVAVCKNKVNVEL
jgi:hypothetical protein